MKNTHTAWHRLVAAARQAPVTPPGEEAAPYGFSTRVAALAMAAAEQRPSLSSVLNRFAWRALTLSLTLMVVSIASNYTVATARAVETEQDIVADPVEEMLTLS